MIEIIALAATGIAVLVTVGVIEIIRGHNVSEQILEEATCRETAYENIQHQIKGLEDVLKKTKEIETVECETCGCLLNKETAIRGPGEIRKLPTRADFLGTIWAYEDGIYYPWYCKVHPPKPKTNKKNQNIGHLST